jgi:hypothetical protein
MTGPASTVVTVWCEFCDAGPDAACATQGQHFGRYLRALRDGLISRQVITDVCVALGSVSAGALVPDTPTPADGGTVTRVTGVRKRRGPDCVSGTAVMRLLPVLGR